MARAAPPRILLNLTLDGALAALALPLALALAGPGSAAPAGWWAAALPLAVVSLLLPGWAFGLPLQYWRYAGFRDMLALIGAAVGGALFLSASLHGFGLWRPGNGAFPVLHALALVAVLSLPRLLGRLGGGRREVLGDETQPILLVGGVDQADLFLRALGRERRPAFRVQGILARRARQSGRHIQGHPILGTLEEAEGVLAALRAEGRLPALLVLASPDLAGPPLQVLLDAADRHGVPVRRAPQPTALAAAGKEGPPRLDLRPVSIEELLDRPQVPLDREGMARLVQGRRVLVTGAGGTIGGELARQVAALGPAMLTLLDHGEYVLYEIDLELSERHAGVPRRAVLADIRDEGRLRRLFEELRPELVFHAAALKHVPMVEADPLEGLLTNAHGTRLVADAARAAGCGLMVFISTDKAVNPTSVMGASKRLAEMYCQALDIVARGGAADLARGGAAEAARGGAADMARGGAADTARGGAADLARGGAAEAGRAPGQAMRCITVRFGNVLGSTGSVVPLFRRQLERGGPLTVTHPDMRRYFMTVREAVGLVLQAAVVGAAGVPWFAGAARGADAPPELKDGGIFVLDMGEPVKIVDLARRMIRLAGLRPDEDVEIRFTGLRPGEKLFEELFHGREAPKRTAFDGLLVATPRTADPAVVGRALDEMAQAARGGHAKLALAQLSRLVPEFEHDPHAAPRPAAARG